MKKNLFYAAFAIAMMASCTNEDNLVVDPVNPTPDAEDKVALTLGIDSPTLIASARSTGSVGDVEGENNQWNSQRLYIAMVDKDGNLAKEKYTEMVDGVEEEKTREILNWTNHEYRAPIYVTPEYNGQNGALSNGDDISNTGNIRIYNNSTYDATTDEGTLHHVYYPTQGTFDFYGWHVDADDAAVGNGSPTIANGTAKVTGITIDGSKDIMGARTKAYDQTNYGNLYNSELTQWAFSARTARNNIKPVLKFEHQLARLKFFVRAGSDKTALKYKGKDDNNNDIVVDRTNALKQDDQGNDIAMSTEAMYVTELSALDMVNKIDMDLNKDGKIETTKAADATDTNTFALGSKGANGQITTLTAVAPEYNINNLPSDASEYKGTPIGESIMFFPNDKASVELQLNLTQYLKQTTNEATDAITYDFKSQDANILVKADKVKLNGQNANLTTFQAGYSYNVYITIYGFEEIVVDAELTPWEEGGDVDVDIEEDDVNNQPEDDDTPTVTPKEFAFNVTNAQQDATVTIKVNGVAIQGTTYNATADFTWEVTDGTTTKSGSVTFADATVLTIDVDLTPDAPAVTPKEFTFNVTNAQQDATVTIKVNGETIQGTTYSATADFTWEVTDGTTTKSGSVTFAEATELAINVDLTPDANPAP